MCGFKSNKDAPQAYVFSRSFNKLFKKEEMVIDIFNRLVDELEVVLLEFGKDLAIDGKAIFSLARGENKNKKEDGRRDLDANWGVKKYKGKNKDGLGWSKVVKWFGYRLHLIVDSNYELPVAFDVTKASSSEVKKAHTMNDR